MWLLILRHLLASPVFPFTGRSIIVGLTLFPAAAILSPVLISSLVVHLVHWIAFLFAVLVLFLTVLLSWRKVRTSRERLRLENSVLLVVSVLRSYAFSYVLYKLSLGLFVFYCLVSLAGTFLYSPEVRYALTRSKANVHSEDTSEPTTSKSRSSQNAHRYKVTDEGPHFRDRARGCLLRVETGRYSNYE